MPDRWSGSNTSQCQQLQFCSYLERYLAGSSPLHRRLRLAEEYVFSFEVFCLHRRSTPTSKAISQSKRLVEKFVRTFSSNPVYGLLS